MSLKNEFGGVDDNIARVSVRTSPSLVISADSTVTEWLMETEPLFLELEGCDTLPALNYSNNSLVATCVHSLCTWNMNSSLLLPYECNI